MASTLLSPGVAIQEKDLTLGSIETVQVNVGAIAGAFTRGPTNTPTRVTSESELLERFGAPTDDNYETWFAASSFLAYGGVLDVVRAAGSTLTNSSVGGQANLRIDNSVAYEGSYYTGSMTWEWAARTAGAQGNAIKVAVIDRGADQNLYLDSVPNGAVTPGTAIQNVAGTKSAYIHSWDATTRRMSIIWTTGGAWTPSANGGDVLEDGTPDVDISSVKVWYNEQEVFTGLKWNQIAPRPGTSPYAADRGGSFDEMHVVVYDSTGAVTGNPNTVLEKLTYLSKASDGKTTEGAQNYYPERILNGSSYIYWGKHEESVWDISANGMTTTAGNLGSVVGTTFDVLGHLQYSMTGGVDDFTLTQGEILAGYELFSDPETTEIDYLIMGGSGANQTESLAKVNKLVSIVTSRKDCMAFVSPHKGDVVGVSDSATQTANIVDFFDSVASNSYTVFDSGYKYMYDRFSDKYRWVACNGDVAGLCASTTANGDPWFSPAGLNRGGIRNAIKLAYSPKKSERDELYQNRINPITSLPGQGIVLFGDKTALASPSAFDRINVRRLFLVVEKTIGNAAKGVLFELNDEFTRNGFNNTVEPFLRDIQARRGITDFLVVADESNNTPAVIDANEFVAEIYIKPARSINFITLTFVATRTGVAFEEVVPRRS